LTERLEDVSMATRCTLPPETSRRRLLLPKGLPGGRGVPAVAGCTAVAPVELGSGVLWR